MVIIKMKLTQRQVLILFIILFIILAGYVGVTEFNKWQDKKNLEYYNLGGLHLSSRLIQNLEFPDILIDTATNNTRIEFKSLNEICQRIGYKNAK